MELPLPDKKNVVDLISLCSYIDFKFNLEESETWESLLEIIDFTSDVIFDLEYWAEFDRNELCIKRINEIYPIDKFNFLLSC